MNINPDTWDKMVGQNHLLRKEIKELKRNIDALRSWKEKLLGDMAAIRLKMIGCPTCGRNRTVPQEKGNENS